MGEFSNLVLGSPLLVVAIASSSCLLRICCGMGISASFIFGDSLVDSGNNNYINTLSKADFPPFGIDFVPEGEATGRFTNGRTIPDLLGQDLGLEVFAPPYLAPTTAGAAVLHGVNYASGGGGILNKTGYIFMGRINFDTQLDNFANTRLDLFSSLGYHAASNLLRKHALFSVTMGSNDFINNYLIPLLSIPERDTVSPDEFIHEMLSKLRQQLKRMYHMDARKIVVVNVGPIGCIPYVREQSVWSGTGCADFPNRLAESFNQKLKALVVELSSSLDGAAFVYADVYNIVSDIVQNYKGYGFEVPDSACCSIAGKFGGLVPCGPTANVCRDRSKYVFWDPYHPSEATNALIAKRLLDGDRDDVFPVTVRQLVASAGGHF